MTQLSPETTSPGLYRVHWLQGGSSLASVYMDEGGRRWIAPTNWIRPGPLLARGYAGVASLDRIDPAFGDEEEE